MNNRLNQERSICKFNLRGMCRFGTRCWNIHEQPVKKENVIMVKPSQIQEDNVQGACLGACALPANNAKETDSSFNKDIYGPSTSSVEEAIALVKISESEERTCGICFDNILQKTNKEEQTFGILPNCNHCFCFTCIRKWRQSKEFEFEVSKACPECRIASDFVYPSKMWMTTKIEKDTFIDNQRKKMKQKDCMYFRKGKGKCPFGNTCLYLHALPNGKVLDVGPPKPRRRVQGTSDADNYQIQQQPPQQQPQQQELQQSQPGLASLHPVINDFLALIHEFRRLSSIVNLSELMRAKEDLDDLMSRATTETEKSEIYERFLENLDGYNF